MFDNVLYFISNCLKVYVWKFTFHSPLKVWVYGGA